MKQITQQEVEVLMEKLADMSISNGSLILCADIEDQLASYSLPDDKRTLSKNEWTWRIQEVIGDKFIYDREQIQVDNELISDLHNIFYFGRFKNIGHPITIGTVFEKYRLDNYQILDLYYKWQPLGISKSLQYIVQDSGWEKKYHTIDGKFPTERYIMGLKSDDANALFNFLADMAL